MEATLSKKIRSLRPPLATVLSLAFASFMWGQSKEKLSLGYVLNPTNEFHAYDLKVGTPPLRFSNSFLVSSFSLREADLELNKISSDIHLKNYKLGVMLNTKLNENFSLLTSPSLSLRNASHSMILKGDSLYPSLLLLGVYKQSEGQGWSYSFGVIYSHEMKKHQFLPAIGATYVNTALRVELGFPSSGISYLLKESFEMGIKANFDSAAYTLPETSNLKVGDAKGIRMRVLDLGPTARIRLYKNLWLTTNLGVVLLAEGHTVSEKGTSKKLIYKGQAPVFLRVALSLF